MDFKKVLDQTVREIKREVNKTILKVPEIEQKVLDATSNEPWGPHGTVMAEIAQATRNYYELQMVMAVLWKRLSDTGRNWRHVYKALTLLEYLVAHGSEKAIDDIKEHAYQISTLADFQFVEPNGKDQGINVQKKSQNLMLLVNDKEKIREVRQKAAENRDKYRGFSSSGVMSKPSSYQSTGGSYGGSYGGDRYEEDNYGRYADDRYSRDRDVDRYRDDDCEGDRSNRLSNQHRDRHNKDYDEDVDNHADHQSSRRPTEKAATVTSNPLVYDVASQSPDSYAAGDQREWKPFEGQSVRASSANFASDGFDDFNPRATSGAAPTTSQFDDLFNQSESSAAIRNSLVSSSFLGDESDLFGGSFSSSMMPAPPSSTVQKLDKDLFGNSLSKAEASESTRSTDLHAAIKPPPSYTPPTGNASVLSSLGALPTSITPPPTFFPGTVVASSTGGVTVNSLAPAASSVNQTASIPFGGDDFFGLDTFSAGAVSSSAGQAAYPLNAPAPPEAAMSGASQTSQASSTSLFNPTHSFLGTTSQVQSGNIRPQQQKRFETKSAIWADGLSKGLIDLNIAGSKSNPLTDIGIDFDQLRTETIKDERMSTGKSTAGMGKAMGSGSGLGVAGATAIAPAAMPMVLNNTGMDPTMGMGMGMSMSIGMGAGMGPMMPMALNPGLAVRPGAGMGSAPGLGIGMRKNSGMGGFSNQQQQYGGFR